MFVLEMVLGSKGSTGVSVLAEERRDQIGKISENYRSIGARKLFGLCKT